MKKFLSLALCLAMLFSCFTYAAPATEYAESAAEVTESALPEETAAAELSAELPDGVEATDTDYGTLIVCENFESRTTGSYLLNGSATTQYPIPQWINSEFFGSLGSRICFDESTGFNSSAVAQILSDGSNKYLKVYNGTTTGSAVTLLRFQNVNSPDGWTRNQPLTAKGTYTVVADYKLPDDGGEAVTSIRNRIFYNYISGSGDKSADTSVDVKTKLTTDKWYTNTVQLTLDGTTVQKITSFGVQSNSTCADTNASGVLQSAVCIDNIKIYYKPYPTITFDANGVEATVPAAETGETFNLNADTYKPTGYDDTKYLFRGWTETPDGEAMYTTAYAPTESKTLYAKWVPLYDDTYGELLVFDDFQKKNIGTNIVNWGVDYVKFERAKNADGVAIQPAFGSDNNSTAVVTDVNGNKMAKITRSGTNQTMSIFTVNMRQVTDAAIADPNARYTALADFYVPGSEDPKFTELRVSIGDGYTHDTSGGGKRAFSSATDTDKVITKFASLHGFNSNASSTNKVHVVYFLDNTPSGVTVTDVENFSYYIDNIRIYKLDVANVTFDANGVTATVPQKTDGAKGKAFDLKSYVPTGFPLTTSFKGWSLTADGEVLGDSFVLTEDVTLYAIWQDAPTHPFRSIKFNSADAYSKAFNNPNSAKNGDAYPEGTVTSEYIADTNGGFQRFTFNKKNTETLLTVGDPMANSKNFAPPLVTKNIKGVAIKYKFNKMPEGANISSWMNIFLSLNIPGTTEYTGIIAGTQVTSTAKVVTTDNEWHTAYFDLASKTNFKVKNGDTVTYKWSDFDTMKMFRLDMLDNAYDGIEMDIAGIDFILADGVTSTALSSTPVLTSANGADAADYRSGVLNVTYDSAPGFTAEDFYTTIVTDSSKVFNGTGNVEKTTNTDGSVTYTMYAVSNLIGKTVTINKDYEIPGKIFTLPASASVTYTIKNFDDGENLVPNGDFSNNFYFPWSKSNCDDATWNIADGAMTVTMGEKGNQWRSLRQRILLKPDTAYYVAYDFTYNNNDNFNAGAKYISNYQAYLPFQNSLFQNQSSVTWKNTPYTTNPSMGNNFDGKTQKFSGIALIKNADEYAKYAIRYTDDKKVTYYRDYKKDGVAVNKTSLAELEEAMGRDKNYYYTNAFYSTDGMWTNKYNDMFTAGAEFSLMTSFDKTINGTDFTTTTGPIKGLTFTVAGLTIKEMWSVNLDPNGAEGEPETVYLAKDETITLPTTTGYTKAGYAFGGWMVNGEKAGAVKAAAFNQDVKISAIWVPVVSHADQTTIRTKTPAGLRFIASVANDVANDTTVEYGFIVTRNELLKKATIAPEDFTFDSEKAGLKMTHGTAHDANTHRTFKTDVESNSTFFAAALVGLKAANYTDVLVVRPYFKAADGAYSYGEPMSASIYEIAEKVQNDTEKFDSLTETQQEVINTILAKEELPTA